MVYEVFKNETYDLIRNKRIQRKLDPKTVDHKSTDEEDETTIDEVLQELRNIVNNAETEHLSKEMFDDKSTKSKHISEFNTIFLKPGLEHKQENDSSTGIKHSIQIRPNILPDDNIEEDDIIVPKIVQALPSRRAKSFLHLLPPNMDQGLLYKPSHVTDDNFLSSDEGSDSLLSASRCKNKNVKKSSLYSFDFKECRAFFNSIDWDKNDNRNKRSRAKSREETRKSSVKRSESFQTSEKGSRQREYIDSLFHSDTRASLVGSAQKSNSKCSRVDEIVNLIESKKLTKSLDRIDEGLNTMVDIVVLNEPKKLFWPCERRQKTCSRSNSDAGKSSPLISISRSNSKLSNGHRPKYECTSYKDDFLRPEPQQKFYMNQNKLSSGTFENQAFSSSTFLVKRGHNSAGFYTGTHMLRDAPASMTSLVANGTHGHSDLKRTMSPLGSTPNNFGSHKVTDMPSGLY